MKGIEQGRSRKLTWVLVEDVRPIPEKENILQKSTSVPVPPSVPAAPAAPAVPVPELPVMKRGRGRPKTKPDVLYHRAPTAYNLFVKGVMAQVKAELPGASSKECMQRCAMLWKEHKASL